MHSQHEQISVKQSFLQTGTVSGICVKEQIPLQRPEVWVAEACGTVVIFTAWSTSWDRGSESICEKYSFHPLRRSKLCSSRTININWKCLLCLKTHRTVRSFWEGIWKYAVLILFCPDNLRFRSRAEAASKDDSLPAHHWDTHLQPPLSKVLRDAAAARHTQKRWHINIWFPSATVLRRLCNVRLDPTGVAAVWRPV